jgi:spore germination protein BB
MLAATFFITMYPKDLNDVFYYGTLLGYAFLIVIAIPFFVWLLSWVQKKLGRGQLQ